MVTINKLLHYIFCDLICASLYSFQHTNEGIALRRKITKDRLLRWLYQEAKENHDAETFPRNGESTDYDDGIFKGREEMANEVISAIEGKFFELRDGRITPVTK